MLRNVEPKEPKVLMTETLFEADTGDRVAPFPGEMLWENSKNVN